MIPQKIHRVWLGPNPIPELYERYWQSWIRQHPQWECKTWRDADLAHLRLYPKVLEADTFAGKADIARYEIIFNEGGFYVDCDFECFRSLEGLSQLSGLLVCDEKEDKADNHLSIGWFGAERGHPALLKMINRLAQDDYAVNSAAGPLVTTGPMFFRAVITGRHDVIAFRHKQFYPYQYDESKSCLFFRDYASAFGCHHSGASWIQGGFKEKRMMDLLTNGYLLDALEQVQETSFSPDIKAGLITMQQDFVSRKAAQWADFQPSLMACLPYLDKAFFSRPEWQVMQLMDFIGQGHKIPMVQMGIGKDNLDQMIHSFLCRYDPVAELHYSTLVHTSEQLHLQYRFHHHTTLKPIPESLPAELSTWLSNSMYQSHERVLIVSQGYEDVLSQVNPERDSLVIASMQPHQLSSLLERLPDLLEKYLIYCAQSETEVVFMSVSMLLNYYKFLVVYHNYQVNIIEYCPTLKA